MNDSVRPEIKKLSDEINSFLVAAEAEREKHEKEKAVADMEFEADNKDVAGFANGSSNTLESEDFTSEDLDNKVESTSGSDVDNISEDEEDFEESDLEELF